MRTTTTDQKPISFHKMHALGNDFMVVIHEKNHPMPTPKNIQHWSNRHLGIGFDQLIWASPDPQKQNTLIVHIANQDGSTAAQCGNGTRCLAALWHQQHPSAKQLTVQIQGQNYRVHKAAQGFCMHMGKPTKVWDIKNITCSSAKREAALVSIGNHHLIISVPSHPKNHLHEAEACRNQMAENHPLNVSFMQVLDKDNVVLATDEHGAGPTLSCASASSAAAYWAHKKLNLNQTIQVQHAKGHLVVTIEEDNIRQTGPACFVFSGQIKYPAENLAMASRKKSETP